MRQDAVGNLFGRIAGDSPRTVLSGSHFDTVKLGGFTVVATTAIAYPIALVYLGAAVVGDYLRSRRRRG